MTKEKDFIEISITYNIQGSTITYKQLKNGTIVAIRGKAGKEIFRISQNELMSVRPGELLGLSSRYTGLKSKALYGMSVILKRNIEGDWIIKY